MPKAEGNLCYHSFGKKRKGWQFGFTLLPTIVAAVLPKCPLCIMSVTSAVGLSFMIKASWLVPLTLSLLLTSIGTLAIRSRKRDSFGPLLAGAFAAAIIMIGKFYLDNVPTIYSGAAILVAASLWNGWPKGKANDDAECRGGCL